MKYIGKRKVRIGQVVSDKMDKTVVVVVETVRRHPLYKKAVKRTKRYKVNDAGNVCKVGDKVKIVETRPLSKEKRWQMVEIISRGESSEIESVGSGEK
ncbi:MAG: 30S ribosomal protein S17 [Dehalococcoidia bacterium]|nr:30S ribosomal protein S17 [Dehalococcoidia bacterium]